MRKQKIVDGPAVYMIRLNAITGIGPCAYQDNGGWQHCSPNIYALCDWAAGLLRYDDAIISEWGSHCNWAVTKLVLTCFKDIHGDGFQQYWCARDVIKEDGMINDVILSKDFKRLKKYLKTQADILLKDSQNSFDYISRK